jgi:S-adenosylmethionine:tRNA ribosyltransferase-isomerase
MKLSDFDYHLPGHLIAQRPAQPRDSSRLMVMDENGIQHRVFHNLPEFLRSGDLLVLNDSRVIPARLYATKKTGGKLELLLVEQLEDNYYECLVKGRIKNGMSIYLNGITGTVVEKVTSHSGYRYHIRFEGDGEVKSHLNDIGVMPLPPYIKAHLDDGERYQTIYAKYEGSIAAPTAGLHFTQELLAKLEKMGVRLAYITLHVGVGTFLPVRSSDISNHIMEKEYFTINQKTARAINDTIAHNSRIIVVGTTTVRAMESACWQDGRITPCEGWSEVFIYPPYSFKTPISGLITNFHLPKSTLLMLVSAYAGKEAIEDAYQKAVNEEYRFYSFGDAMLLLNQRDEKHV